jgi:hypothetical protein
VRKYFTSGDSQQTILSSLTNIQLRIAASSNDVQNLEPVIYTGASLFEISPQFIPVVGSQQPSQPAIIGKRKRVKKGK